MSIIEIIKKDRQARQPDQLPTDSQLQTLDSLNFDLSYDYSYPTLINENDYNKAHIAHRTSEEFASSFFKYFPLLKNVSLKNMLIAGGSVGHYLTDKSKHSGDIDCFFYGLSTDQADERIKEFIKDLFLAQAELERKEEEERQLRQGASGYSNMQQVQQVQQMQQQILNMRSTSQGPTSKREQDEDDEQDEDEDDDEDDDENSSDEGSGSSDEDSNTHEEAQPETAKEESSKDQKAPEKPENRFKLNAHVQLIRNRSGISININDQIYQVIFRLYKSKSEILHGFDLGPSAVGFDGTTVFLTALGKLSYENRIIVVDTTRRSTTYEYRIQKYFKRGFELVLPELNIASLPTEYHKYKVAEVCEFPFLPFSYTAITGNKIVLGNFLQVPKVNGDLVNNADGDSVSTSDYNLANIDEYQLMYLNLYGLIHGDGLEKMYYFSKYPSFDILSKPPFLSVKSIMYFYETARKEIVSNGHFNFGLIKKYFTIVGVEEVLKNTILDPKGTEETRKAYLDSIFKQQAEAVIQSLNKVIEQDHTKIPWITENPGTQLTSSFNPIIENASHFYGRYFKTF